MSNVDPDVLKMLQEEQIIVEVEPHTKWYKKWNATISLGPLYLGTVSSYRRSRFYDKLTREIEKVAERLGM